jgi:hypothetical protein
VRVLQQGMAQMARQFGDDGALAQVAAQPAEPGSAAAALAESRAHLLMLAARVMALEFNRGSPDTAALGHVRGEVDSARRELGAQGEVLNSLHHFVSYDLKRQVAEFVNAYVQAQIEIHVLKPREGGGASRPQQSHG